MKARFIENKKVNMDGHLNQVCDVMYTVEGMNMASIIFLLIKIDIASVSQLASKYC